MQYGKAPGALFPSTKLTPKRKASSACKDSDDDCKAMLEEIPDFDSLFERKTTQQVQSLLDRYISGGKDTEEEKYGKTEEKSSDPVDKAFNELLGEDLPA